MEAGDSQGNCQRALGPVDSHVAATTPATRRSRRRSSRRSCRAASRSHGTPWSSRRGSPPGAASRTPPGRAPAAPSGSASTGPPPPPRVPPGPPGAGRRRTPCHRRRPRTPGRREAPAPPRVVRLAGKDREPHEMSQGVHDGHDLARQAASGTADPLARGPPFAPDAFRCARTTVPSTNTHSRPDSSDRASETRAKTPGSARRRNRLEAPSRFPDRAGRSRHGDPVRNRHSTASMKRRLSAAVPPCRRGRTSCPAACPRSAPTWRRPSPFCLDRRTARSCRCCLVPPFRRSSGQEMAWNRTIRKTTVNGP